MKLIKHKSRLKASKIFPIIIFIFFTLVLFSDNSAGINGADIDLSLIGYLTLPNFEKSIITLDRIAQYLDQRNLLLVH